MLSMFGEAERVTAICQGNGEGGPCPLLNSRKLFDVSSCSRFPGDFGSKCLGWTVIFALLVSGGGCL